MLEVTRGLAAALGWPDEAVHFEYFKNTHPFDSSTSFTVELARSALSLAVPPGKVDPRGAARQWHFGAVLVRAGGLRHLPDAGVLEGVPEHQDVYLERHGEKLELVPDDLRVAVQNAATGARYLMLTLYDYELSGNCYKLRLFMAIIGLRYEIVPIDFYPGREHKSEAFLEPNPLGQLPVLVDDGEVLRDSGAILVHLASKYDRIGLWHPAADPTLLAEVDAWHGFADKLTETISAARLAIAMFYPFDLRGFTGRRAQAVPAAR